MQKIDQLTFETAKKMLNIGKSGSEISRVFDVHHSTISRIKEASSFEEYKEMSNGHARIKSTRLIVKGQRVLEKRLDWILFLSVLTLIILSLSIIVRK